MRDDLGEQGGEPVGDVPQERFAQAPGDAPELAVERFVAPVVGLPVASQVGLPPRALVFDERIEDPGDQLGEGHDVLIAASPMSLVEVREDRVGNAIGEECERRVGQWQALQDLAREVRGRVRLGAWDALMRWQNHGDLHVPGRGPRTTPRPTTTRLTPISSQ